MDQVHMICRYTDWLRTHYLYEHLCRWIKQRI